MWRGRGKGDRGWRFWIGWLHRKVVRWWRPAAGRRRSAIIGRRGERDAEAWLRARGYVVIARNRRFHREEADLICRTPRGSVVIVEVKATAGPARALEARVDQRKRRVLRRLARRLGRHFEGRVRWEVVTVRYVKGAQPEIRHRRGPCS